MSDLPRCSVELDANELGILALQIERNTRIFEEAGKHETAMEMWRRAEELRAVAWRLWGVVA